MRLLRRPQRRRSWVPRYRSPWQRPVRKTLEGKAAFGDWRTDKPGTRRLIRPQDLPAADQAASAPLSLPCAPQRAAKAGRSRRLRGPAVRLWLDIRARHPRRAPTATSSSPRARPAASACCGRRTARRARAANERLRRRAGRPFGIAFYPPGPIPQWVYVANTDSVVRFPYRSGDLKARGPAETIVPQSAGRRRPLDARRRVLARRQDACIVSVGSGSNVGDDMGKLSAAAICRPGKPTQPLGAAWGNETRPRRRARLRSRRARTARSSPPASATASAWRSQPATGDALVLDQRARRARRQPAARLRHARARGRLLRLALVLHRRQRGPAARAASGPTSRTRSRVPDVLIQAHSASLQMTFYDGDAVPGRIPRRRLRRRARLLEPRQAHRLQGHPRAS